MNIQRALILSLAIITLFAFVPFEAGAQGASYNQYLEQLSTLNRVDPNQKPSYDSGNEILKRRIIDNKNKVVGEVRDVILTPNGSISLLSVEFNRLRLRSSVFLNYAQMNIRPVSNGYALAFDDDQIENIYPELLANIETAAGESSEDFSVRSVVGSTVKSKDGRNIGKVDNVLFGSNGSRAEVLYVAMAYSILRGKKVALPYGSVKFSPKGQKTEVTVSDEQANAIIDFVKDN